MVAADTSEVLEPLRRARPGRDKMESVEVGDAGSETVSAVRGASKGNLVSSLRFARNNPRSFTFEGSRTNRVGKTHSDAMRFGFSGEVVLLFDVLVGETPWVEAIL